MSQTLEHELSLLFDWAADYDVVDCGLCDVVGTDEGVRGARDFALAQAAAELVMASDEGRRTPLDLLAAVRLPLDDDLPA